MLYRLVPTLIEQGYVYIAESPLYEITYATKAILRSMRAKSGYPQKLEGKKILNPALQGSRREPARNDVGDHHEPRKPPPDPHYAG